MIRARRRILAALLTTVCTAGLIAGATPASAQASTFCPESGSTRLLTANDGDYKVWVYGTTGWTHICFAAPYYGAGDLMVGTGVTGNVVPTISPVMDPNCARWFELQDPAHLLIQWGGSSILGNPFTICLGAEGTAIKVTIGGPTVTVNPGVQLWFDDQYNSYLAREYCTVVPANCPSYLGDPVRVI